MVILRSGRREGSSYVFENGYRLSQRGDLIMERPQKELFPMVRLLRSILRVVQPGLLNQSMWMVCGLL